MALNQVQLLASTLVKVNTGDLDGDGVPNFADECNVFEGDGVESETNNGLADTGHIGINFPLPREVDPSATVTISYSGSDPAQMTLQQTSYGYAYTPAAGSLRIWNPKEGFHEQRRVESASNGGHYVTPGQAYTLQDLGIENASNASFVVEGIRPSAALGDQEVTISVDTLDSEGEPVSYSKTVHFTVLAAPELVTLDGESGQVVPAAYATSISNPVPEVELEITDAELNAAGELEISVAGKVRDALSETFESSGDRVQQLNFFINGQPAGEPKTLSYSGPGTPPFTFADSETEFAQTFAIPNPQPGAYLIKAETAANAAGNKGWDKSVVSLVQAVEPGAGTLGPVKFGFDTPPSSLTVDEAWAEVEIQSNSPQQVTLTETSEDSNQFSGTVTVNGTLITCTLSVRVPLALSSMTEDELEAELRYAGGGVAQRFAGTWLETGQDSEEFQPDGQAVQGLGVTLTVGKVEDLPGSQLNEFQPLVFRSDLPDGITGQGEVKAYVNGHEHPMKEFNYGGSSSFYAVGDAGDANAKVFIGAAEGMPVERAIPGLTEDGGAINWSVYAAGQEAGAAPMYVEPAPEPEPSGSSGSNPYWKPGDTITRDHVMTAFRFLYHDALSRIMLEQFELAESQDEAELELGEVWGDYDFDYYNRIGSSFAIQIEEDSPHVHPGIAAQYLWRGLNDAYTWVSWFRTRVDTVAANDGQAQALIEAMQNWRVQVGQGACETGIAAAEFYLSGIGVVLEPVDWVFVIDDVSEGHWSSLAAALPFIPRGLAAGARGVRIENRAGEVLEHFADEASIDVLRELYLIRDLRQMGVLMDEAQMSASLRKAFSSNGGQIAVPGKYPQLRKNMERVSPPPPGRYHAHHDFPWAEKKWFALHGIDVDDPAFGRWVTQLDHITFHGGSAGGGDFNKFWTDWMKLEDDANPYTVQQILERLAECRQRFPVTASYD